MASPRGLRVKAIGVVFALISGLVAGVVVTAAPASAARSYSISTFAGTGTRGFSGDGGPATDATLGVPRNLARDASGNLYINDRANVRIREVDSNGVISTVAGGGSPADGVGDGLLATDAKFSAIGLAFDAAGNMYIADSAHESVRRVDAVTRIITTVAGGNGFGYSGDGGPATGAQFAQIHGVSLDAAGNLYIGDNQNQALRKVDTSGTITTLAQGFGRADDVTSDPAGNVYVSIDANQVKKVDPAGNVTLIAGTGNNATGGDGGPATSADIWLPWGLSLDGSGNLYIAENRASKIRKVDTSGIITTVAGTGSPGYNGDGIDPVTAQLNAPQGVVVDGHGGFYVGDSSNQRVRHVFAIPDVLGVAMTTAQSSVVVGDPVLTYNIAVTSNTGDTATGVVATQTLPSNVSFTSATPSQGSCSQAAGVVTCQLGSMAADATASIVVNVVPTQSGIATTTVSVRADQPDPLSRNDTATVSTQIGARGCGRTITTNTKLSADLGPCPAKGLVVGADGITLNLGKHRIYGFPGPSDGNSAGIVLPNRTNVTVVNGTVTDFDAGILLNGGSANTVQNMTLRDNIGPDDEFTAFLGDGIIMFESGANFISANVLDHNGIYDGIGVYGRFSGGNTIQNNTIKNTVGPSDGSSNGQGIRINAFNEDGLDGHVIDGLTIANNIITDNANAGVSTNNMENSTISHNTVTGNGKVNTNRGNGIAVQIQGTAVTQITNDLIDSNQVKNNQRDGIQVAGGHATKVQKNVVTGNGNNVNAFDVDDLNHLCGDDVWWRNTFITFSPDCARGGTTPSSAASTGSATPAQAFAKAAPANAAGASALDSSDSAGRKRPPL